MDENNIIAISIVYASTPSGFIGSFDINTGKRIQIWDNKYEIEYIDKITKNKKSIIVCGKRTADYFGLKASNSTELRQVIILSRTNSDCSSYSDLYKYLKRQQNVENVFILGGAQILNDFLDQNTSSPLFGRFEIDRVHRINIGKEYSQANLYIDDLQMCYFDKKQTIVRDEITIDIFDRISDLDSDFQIRNYYNWPKLILHNDSFCEMDGAEELPCAKYSEKEKHFLLNVLAPFLTKYHFQYPILGCASPSAEIWIQWSSSIYVNITGDDFNNIFYSETNKPSQTLTSDQLLSQLSVSLVKLNFIIKKPHDIFKYH